MLRILGRTNSYNVRKVLWVCDELGVAFEREDWGRGYQSTSDPRFLVLRTSRDQIPILIDPERVTPRCLIALAATLRDLRDRDRRVLGLDARYRGQVIVRCAPDSLGEAPSQRDKV